LPLKPNLKVLDVSGLKLKNLEFLKDQQDIEILVAESNELTNECFKEIAHLKKLQILSL
jgi:Leucine-rich repeat (LRR) protein